MAFTGTAAITKVADNCYRITGLSLANAAAGTIALGEYAGAADVEIAGTGWNRYETSGLHGGMVELDDSVDVQVKIAQADAAIVEDVAVTKAGNGPTDFIATVTNLGTEATGALEIYVRFH